MSEGRSIDQCPPDEVLSAFADGALAPEERQRVTRHLAQCSECGEVAAAAVEFLSEPKADSAEVARRRWRLLVAASIAVAFATALVWRMLVPEDPLASLRRAATAAPTRPVEGWLVGFDHAPFEQPRSARTAALPIEILAATRELQQTRADSPRLLHARGIAALFTGEAARATTMLGQAAAASPGTVAYWSDLAAAEIAFGTASQSLDPFRHAVTAADRALALSPTLAAAHFNRATALEHLGRREAAVRSYRAALSTSLPPPWRTEVLERLD